MERQRWGILGTGWAAEQFIAAIRARNDAQIISVGSRNGERAHSFAERHGIAGSGTYRQVAEHPDINVIFIATPVTSHLEHCLLCIDHGKPVLCEKPLAANAGEAALIAKRARARNVFCMEAMWTRFLPGVQAIKDAIRQGSIGKVHFARAELGIRQDFANPNRLMEPALGGHLLDLGVYPLSFLQFLFGNPSNVNVRGSLHSSGTVGFATLQLEYREVHATVSTSALSTLENGAGIFGDKGSIYVLPPIYAPEGFVLKKSAAGRPANSFRRHPLMRLADRLPVLDHLRVRAKAAIPRGKLYGYPIIGIGIQNEITEAMRCISDGRVESRIMPLDDSCSVLSIIDDARTQILASK